MASQGPNSAGTFANDGGSGGSYTWSNLSFASTSNNQYATCTVNASGVTYFLKCTNFGFAIPGGSTIDGIYVGVECWSDNSGATDLYVQLVKGGTISGDNKAYFPDITIESVVPYGGISDLWGLSFTVADINSSTFGIAWAGQNTSMKSGVNYYIDHVTITVYYTGGGGGGVVSKIFKTNIAKITASNF